MKRKFGLKKLLILILLISGLETYSQNDTVCIPRADAIRKLVQIENLKADSAQLVLRLDEIKDLKYLSGKQDVMIKDLQDRGVNQEFRIANLQEQNYATTKELKKMKAKATVFKVAGIGITAGLLFAVIFFK